MKSQTGRIMLHITGKPPLINRPLLLSDSWRRIWFRPRVMRDVTTVDFSTRILGHPTKMPIYIVCIPFIVSPRASC